MEEEVTRQEGVVFKNWHKGITYTEGEMRDLVRKTFVYIDGKVYRKSNLKRPKALCLDGRMKMCVGGAPISEHRVVWLMFNDTLPKGKEIDHKDHHPLNNDLTNLRAATHVENMRNRPKQKGRHTSKYKGVCYKSARKKYEAGITYDGKYRFLGYFQTEEEAAEVYNREAALHFGDFAVLNETGR